ncbi:TPA: IS481 family transposase, partial [Vibrio vulnificus]|nr:IS481 family transposase [Vibrio vulnificus]
TPIDRITEISDQTPLSEEVSQNYQIKKERFQEQNYRLDLRLRKLKPSL